MIKADLPENENERLKALYQYNILDTLPEKEFDSLNRLAAYICDTPIALISLIDDKRQWFKSSIGLNIAETPRDISFCSHALLQNDVFTVKNTLEDTRFQDNPLVMSEPNIRFYAGIPVESSDGYKLGTLCVIDIVPRELTDKQKDALKDLSCQITALLELRLNQKNLNEAKNKIEEERSNLFSLIENTDDSIWSVDKNLNILSLNSAFKKDFYRIMGFYPELGMNLNESIDFKDPRYKPWKDCYQKAMSGEKVLIQNEFNIDGKKTYHEACFSPIINNNQIKGVTVFYKDVTQQKINENKIRESEERFKKFSEISLEGISIGQDGVVIDVNKAITDMFGYTKKEMLTLSPDRARYI